jgi:hypothetical protein
MNPKWKEAVEQLEGATRALLAAAPRELGQRLAERGRAVARLAGLCEAPQPLPEELLARLRAALAEGAELGRRVTLSREQARVALDELTRAAALLKRLQESEPAPASRLDCRG